MTRVLPLTVCLFLAAHSTSPAQDASAGKGGARIAPLLDAQTLAVLRIDVSHVQVGKLTSAVSEIAGLPDRERKELEDQAKQFYQMIQGLGVREVFAIMSLADLPAEPVFLAAPAEDVEANLDRIEEFMKHFGPTVAVKKIRGFVVAGRKTTLRRLEEEKSAADKMLLKGLAATGKADVELVVAPSQVLRRSLKEMIPTLPPELGGKETAPLVDGFRWASASAVLQPPLSLEVTVRTTGPQAATDQQQLIARLVPRLIAKIHDINRPPNSGALAKLLTPKIEADRLVLKLTQPEAAPLVRAMAARVHLASAKIQSSNNLKQIGLALHNYCDVHKALPAQGNYDKHGQPLLSWRVHILPFIEQEALYKEFKLDEPWDSPHNKKLIARMPPIYRNPQARTAAGKTTYLAPIGPATIFGPTPTRLRDIKDGTSNTIMVVEAADDAAVYWTQPSDLPVDPRNPFRGLANYSPGAFQALFADVSVRAIPRTVSPAILNAWFTKDRGDPVPNH